MESVGSDPNPVQADVAGGSRRDFRATWGRAFLEFFGAVLFVLGVRWAVFEPYVIPSGSMIPTLLIHDHIFVNKFAYGLRIPFGKHHLLRWASPKQGDVIVFRAVDGSDIFLIKRVIATSGDEITIAEGGSLSVNGRPLGTAPAPDGQIDKLIGPWPEATAEPYLRDFDFMVQEVGDARPIVLHEKDRLPQLPRAWTVPDGHLFMMGDNRDHSQDSRYWGTVPLDHVLGRASVIWLSCEDTLHPGSRLCDPAQVRWHRLFSFVR